MNGSQDAECRLTAGMAGGILTIGVINILM